MTIIFDILLICQYSTSSTVGTRHSACARASSFLCFQGICEGWSLADVLADFRYLYQKTKPVSRKKHRRLLLEVSWSLFLQNIAKNLCQPAVANETKKYIFTTPLKLSDTTATVAFTEVHIIAVLPALLLEAATPHLVFFSQ